MKQRTDFVSNSSSSSFIIDAKADPYFGSSYSFEEYLNDYLNRDVFPIFDFLSTWQGINNVGRLRLCTDKELISAVKSDSLRYCISNKDSYIANRMNETACKLINLYKLINSTTDNDQKKIYNDEYQTLFRQFNADTEHLLNTIKDILLPVFKDYKLRYLSASDHDDENDGGMNEDEAREHFHSLNCEFSRYYNNH